MSSVYTDLTVVQIMAVNLGIAGLAIFTVGLCIFLSTRISRAGSHPSA